jgi:hypothetical protein
MSKRKGSVSISKELGLKWLKLYDDRITISKIANNDGYDYRTVKKYIGIARSEQELKDQRSIVLRNALERHFADLVNIIEIMMNWIDTGQAIEFAGDDEFLQNALHDHIPRSPVWALTRRWNSSIADLTRLEISVRGKLENKIISDTSLAAINERKGGELFKRIRSTFKYNPKDRGQSQLKLDVEFPENEMRANLSRLVSSAVLAYVDLDNKESVTVKNILANMNSEMATWEEFAGFKDIYPTLADIRTKLKEELRVLKWKRIVTGRCLLCPM